MKAGASSSVQASVDGLADERVTELELVAVLADDLASKRFVESIQDFVRLHLCGCLDEVAAKAIACDSGNVENLAGRLAEA
jgi:hypothetical protein